MCQVVCLLLSKSCCTAILTAEVDLPLQVPPKEARDTGQVLVRYENNTGYIHVIEFGVKKEFSDEMVPLWA
jgi:hypothetical protein